MGNKDRRKATDKNKKRKKKRQVHGGGLPLTFYGLQHRFEGRCGDPSDFSGVIIVFVIALGIYLLVK